jgi:hypothetical protein
LKSAGILSLEQVLLPALGLQEERALKQVQAKIQRDAPEYKFVMEKCRHIVRQSIINAIVAVQTSRSERMQCQNERRQQKALEFQKALEARELARREERKRKAEERKHKREIAKAEKKRMLTRQHPKNLGLWKEVVFLTSSISQLEKEERMWLQAEQDLIRLGGIQETAMKCAVSGQENQSMTPQTVVLHAPKHQLHIETERKLKDIILASTRIQNGIGMILKLLEESDKVQQELYENYRNDHVFHGYHEINNPKGMIRFLSQSQDDNF